MKELNNINLAGLAKAIIYALLVTAVHYSTLTWLVKEDWQRPDFSYGILIPFVVLYLIWEKKDDLTRSASIPTWTGLIIFIPGIAFFWLGELSGEFFSLYLSLWFLCVGLCWLHLGWQKLKHIAFALIVMLTMFPPPHFIFNKISFFLKLISSKIGVAMIQMYGMSAYREGNVIDLGFTQLQVVDACSGLRYLIPLIVLALLLAYFYKGALWKKAIILFSSIPLSIITNSLRIAMTGILYEDWGPAVAEGFFHGFSGWFIFMFSLAVLLLEMWILNKIGRQETGVRRQETEVRSQESGGRRQETEVRSQESGGRRQETEVRSQESGGKSQESEDKIPEAKIRKGASAFFYPPQFVVAVVLLGLTLGLSQGIEFRETVPVTKSLDQFSRTVGQWTGTSELMEQKFIDSLDLSDYIIIDYKNQKGQTANFYVAYYASQRKGESIHSPATCLPGSGWVFKNAGTVEIPMPSAQGGSMPVNKAFMQKGNFKQLTYYWFPARGRILTNAYQLKIYNFWDALTRQRTDGALVRLITPVYENEDLEDAEARLQDFAQAVVPELNSFLPN